MSGYAEELEQLMAKYRERRASAGERQRKINATTGTATSQRQTVKVTVNVAGFGADAVGRSIGTVAVPLAPISVAIWC